MGIHCPALGGDGQGEISLRQPLHRCAIETRAVGKGSVPPLHSQRLSAKGKDKGHHGNFSFIYIFNLKSSFHFAGLNRHVLEAQWRKGCGDSGNLSQIVQLW